MPSQPGQAKSLVFYCAVLAAAASSVAFGLDWTVAPLPPMPETAASVQAAKLAAHLPPPVVRVARAEPTPSPQTPPTPSAPSAPRSAPRSAPSPALAVVNPTPQGTQDAYGAPAVMAPEPVAQPVSTQPQCDVAACSAAYRSFNATDCTWQPYEGPRRFCDKGQPPAQAAATAAPAAAGAAAAAGVAQVSNKCDIAACKQAYFTFNPSDCTYQPSDGPRRLCDKGHPPPPSPQAQTAIDPAVAAANAANAANAAKAANTVKDTNAANAAKVTPPPPKCNVDACKQAYFTFNPVDCTYQPSQGPRTLCEK